ncbi:hypothetical protein MNBD_GAMMA07-1943 [hydrothermal vent metagenome]|uniref:Glycosyltransferase 2-like domain-containing protein n=1 Tax=hydrothermal vent metagenome TaxID=652676 RepID=A0A3B0WNS1_9ZZZZ
MKPLTLSIIIPCLNESTHIVSSLKKLQKIRSKGHEIILCDGGSKDNTLALANNLADHILNTQPGRAKQMNMGAQIASGDVLCFLHADTIIPANFEAIITHELHQSDKIWGRFNIKLSNSFWPYRVISWFINTRSCMSGVATGDQGIFIYKENFLKLKGYADIPLMEDIEISKRLRKTSRPICINKSFLITSSRRWEQFGIFKTVILMWHLRLRYFLGASPTELAKFYHNS